jgi:hypothetical protein
MMMTTREQKYRQIVETLEGLTFVSITAVNFKPHPYTVGPEHIAYAADHHGGVLGEATSRKLPCAHRDCNLAYDEHVHDTALFLSLTRNMSQEEAQGKLQILVDAGMKRDGIDGLAFVATTEGFKFTTTKEGVTR